MSFGGQSNTWQRGMMQSQPQTKSFQKDPPQMFMQTKQQNKMPNCGYGGMYPNFVSGGNLSYTQPRSGLNPAEFQGIGDEIDRSTGIITNIKNDCGLINNEVFFYDSEFKGQDLKLGDRVRFDASLSTSGKFKWNATRIRLMPPNSKEVMDSTKSNYSGNIQMVQRHISPNRISPVRGGGGSVRYERDRYERERDRDSRHHSRDRNRDRDSRHHSMDRDRGRNSRHHSSDRDEEEPDRRRRREERERSRERINTTSSVRPTSRAPDRERERERVWESSRERIYSERNRMLERDHRNDKYKERERLDTELFRRRDPALIANALPHKFDDVQEMSNRHTTPSTMSYFPTNSTKREGYRNPSMMQQCSTFKSQMASNLVEAHASSTGNAVQRQSTAKPVTSVHREHETNDSMPFKIPPSASEATTSAPPKHKNPSRRAYTSKRSAYKILHRLSIKPIEQLTDLEAGSLKWAKKHIDSLEKHKTPAKREYTKRSAYKIISRFGEMPIEELTEAEFNSLQWARKHIKGLQRASSPAEDASTKRSPSDAAPKRQPSEEDTLPKTYTSTRPQTREAAKDHLIWAVIDRNNSEESISPRNWKKVVIALSRAFLKLVRERPGPPPQCQDAGWYQGHIKQIACADERSALLYKTAIESIGEVWSGARLAVVPIADVTQRPRSIAKVPAVPSDPKDILKTLQVSNPQLPTQDWKVVRVTDDVGGYRNATVVLNSDSLSLLRKTQGKVYYGFGSTFLRVYRGDDKVQPLVQENTDCRMSCYEEAEYSYANEDTHSVSGSDDIPEDANVHNDELQ